MIICPEFDLYVGLVFLKVLNFCMDCHCSVDCVLILFVYLMYLQSIVCLYVHWLMILQDVLNSVPGQNKSRLMFPNLSMLDIGNNQLREIPHNIHELTNLSVLNISGNLGELLVEFICIIFFAFGRWKHTDGRLKVHSLFTSLIISFDDQCMGH